jgi:hypothetical protein
MNVLGGGISDTRSTHYRGTEGLSTNGMKIDQKLYQRTLPMARLSNERDQTGCSIVSAGWSMLKAGVPISHCGLKKMGKSSII